MTIDLGFAHIDLPSGERVGVVDVPGHVRFLHNMLSGVHGIDVVLLVVAADEGVMPQTREHLDILELMDARRLVLALTKVDLVDAEWLPLVKQEVEAELARRGFADVSAIAVSVPRGQGIEEVRAALTELVAQARIDDEGRPRLPIDRSFTMPGFGTVVTGSLVDGSIVVGQELELAPPTAANSHTRLRVRGLQQHGRSVERAMPGTRGAVNLAGIEHEALHRGQVLALAGSLSVTTRVDGRR